MGLSSLLCSVQAWVRSLVLDTPPDRISMSLPKKLSEPAWLALAGALVTYHWYKREFETLVRGLFNKAPDVLAAVNFGETKRIATDQLVRALRLYEHRYQNLVLDALLALSEFDPEFTHLARVNDGHLRIAEAKAAHKAVQSIIEHSELAASREAIQREATETAAREAERQLHKSRLIQLHEQFLRMQQSSDQPQKRGKEFEGFLNALFELWDLNPRAAYSIEHEQVDGAFTFRTDDYILEARWWADPLEPKELNDFKVKVDSKALNTLGLYVSISGFTQGAILKHSGGRTPLILMDGRDLMPILEGYIDLTEVLEKKRRYAAETGTPMHRVWGTGAE